MFLTLKYDYLWREFYFEYKVLVKLYNVLILERLNVVKFVNLDRDMDTLHIGLLLLRNKPSITMQLPISFAVGHES